MKLLYLEVNGYKNLSENTKFDFSTCTNYAALIGLNGSGKSNIVEAISIIFASQFLSKNTGFWNNGENFSYKISYQLRNYEIEISNGIITLISENGELRNRLIRTNKKEYLPSEIFACYSGDENRLWNDIYKKFYFSYLSRISKGYRDSKQPLIYINKYSWDFALLCLICHDRSQNSIKDILKIEDLEQIKINFIFPENYEKRKEWFSKTVEVGIQSSNDITSLVQRLKDEQDRTNEDLIFTQINSLEIGTANNDSFCRKLFYLLFAAGMPKENKLFEKISIKFNSIGIKQLSEGEKKIIVIKCISDILANENSIILLDEPDAHVHLTKKKELKTVIDKEGFFSILTTHSPTLCKYSLIENLFFLENGENIAIQDQFNAAKLLVDDNDVFKLLFSVKHLIITEGKTDVQYISKAIKLFETLYPTLSNIEFLVLGGTDSENAKNLLSKIRNIEGRKVILIVDRDDAGLNCAKKVLANQLIERNTFDNDYIPNSTNQVVLMLPKTNTLNGEFVIEDYFKKDKVKELTKNHIDSMFNTSKVFKQFPKVKDDLKTELLPAFCDNVATSVDMEDFKILLNKLRDIINA